MQRERKREKNYQRGFWSTVDLWGIQGRISPFITSNGTPLVPCMAREATQKVFSLVEKEGVFKAHQAKPDRTSFDHYG